MVFNFPFTFFWWPRLTEMSFHLKTQKSLKGSLQLYILFAWYGMSWLCQMQNVFPSISQPLQRGEIIHTIIFDTPLIRITAQDILHTTHSCCCIWVVGSKIYFRLPNDGLRSSSWQFLFTVWVYAKKLMRESCRKRFVFQFKNIRKKKKISGYRRHVMFKWKIPAIFWLLIKANRAIRHRNLFF